MTDQANESNELGDSHIAWIRTPGPNWKTDPGEPTAAPNRITVNGVQYVWDPESDQYVPEIDAKGDE